MSNSFSKEERVAFEKLLEGFQDALVLSRNVSVFQTDQVMMERSGDTIRRPMPYILSAFDGMDQSANYKNATQLTVPASIDIEKSVPFMMDPKELRDMLQEQRLFEAAKQQLASAINLSIMNAASNQSSLVVARSAAASGFDDVAQCEAIMNEQGVPDYDRYLALSTRDYNNMASNLAGRQTMQGKPTAAYERAYVGTIASFDTFKLDYANRLTAAAGGAGITIDTQASASNYYVPMATSTATTGQRSNVDNRYQTITVSSTTNVAAGDCFTIAGVYACHHITKSSTGQLKTFRVISVGAGGTTLTISPAIISNQGGSDAEAQYQNVIVTPSATAAIVFLNTQSAYVNVFWQKDALEILPGRYAVPMDGGANVMRASTDQGFELVVQKQWHSDIMKYKFRVDTLYGVVNKQPEMSGIVLFSQT